MAKNFLHIIKRHAFIDERRREGMAQIMNADIGKACTLAGADGGARAVLHPYPEQHTDLDQWGKGGLYPLVPYSGRVRDAAGRPPATLGRYCAPFTHVDTLAAMLVRAVLWMMVVVVVMVVMVMVVVLVMVVLVMVDWGWWTGGVSFFW